MILKDGRIPPQPGMPFNLNSKFPPLDKIGIQIASRGMTLMPNPEGDGKKRLVVNSFDAAVR